jgi:hypothetical protein
MGETVTRSRVRGKHPFVFSLDLERLFVQGECLTRMVRCPGQLPRSVRAGTFEKVREVSRWSQHCKLLPGSGHGRESFRSASFPIRFGPIRSGRISFNRNALSSFTVSLVPE